MKLTEVEKPNDAAHAEGARLEKHQGHEGVRREPPRALPEREHEEQHAADGDEGDDLGVLPAARRRLDQRYGHGDEREREQEQQGAAGVDATPGLGEDGEGRGAADVAIRGSRHHLLLPRATAGQEQSESEGKECGGEDDGPDAVGPAPGRRGGDDGAADGGSDPGCREERGRGVMRSTLLSVLFCSVIRICGLELWEPWPLGWEEKTKKPYPHRAWRSVEFHVSSPNRNLTHLYLRLTLELQSLKGYCTYYVSGHLGVGSSSDLDIRVVDARRVAVESSLLIELNSIFGTIFLTSDLYDTLDSVGACLMVVRSLTQCDKDENLLSNTIQQMQYWAYLKTLFFISRS